MTWKGINCINLIRERGGGEDEWQYQQQQSSHHTIGMNYISTSTVHHIHTDMHAGQVISLIAYLIQPPLHVYPQLQSSPTVFPPSQSARTALFVLMHTHVHIITSTSARPLSAFIRNVTVLLFRINRHNHTMLDELY